MKKNMNELKNCCKTNVQKNAEFKKRVRNVLLNTGYPDYALAIRAFNQVVAISGQTIGATDCTNLYLNENLNDDELSLVARHEILHILLKHRAREPKKGLRFHLWNKACDYELSNYYSVYDESVLAQSALLDGACYVGNSPQYSDKTAPAIYHDLLKEAEQQEQQKKQQQSHDSEGHSGKSNHKESDNAEEMDDIQRDQQGDTQPQQNNSRTDKDDMADDDDIERDTDSDNESEEQNTDNQDNDTDEDGKEDADNQEESDEDSEKQKEQVTDESDEQADDLNDDESDEDNISEDNENDMADDGNEDNTDSDEDTEDGFSNDLEDSMTPEQEDSLCRAIEMAVAGGYEELSEEEREQMKNSELVQLSSNNIVTPVKECEPPKPTAITRLRYSLKSYFIKQEQVEKGRTYRKGNKKYYGSPFIIKGKSNIYKPSKTIACYVDVSGSMSKEKVQRAINVVEGLKKIKRLEVKIHYFDTEIKDFFFKGQCTDYVPIFEHAKENNYTCLAIITDDTNGRATYQLYDFEAIWLIGIDRRYCERNLGYYGPEEYIATKTHPATKFNPITGKPYITCKKFHFDLILPESETE